MNSKVTLFTLTLIVLYVASTEAALVGTTGMSLHCQCIKTTSKFIHPKAMENIAIIPSSPHCENVEISATLQNTNQFCLNPESAWVKKIINKMISHYSTIHMSSRYIFCYLTCPISLAM
ncbi:interleukin-8-like [Carcharodon carcharias]|uniref:interleukin-8-like n=1 Tax=Carcharodon carcharias TaxID=13397 RepID=UPI001B7F720E|nr:interleukin-8-like [Carcharodon carcharias]